MGAGREGVPREVLEATWQPTSRPGAGRVMSLFTARVWTPGPACLHSRRKVYQKPPELDSLSADQSSPVA